MGRYGDNYLEWMYGRGGVSKAFDESLEEHDKKYHKGHYDPARQECGLREEAKREDDLGDGGNGGGSPTYDSLKEIYEKEGVSKELVEATRKVFEGIRAGAVKPKRIPKKIFNSTAVAELPEWVVLAYIVGSNYGDDEGRAKKVILDFAEEVGQRNDNITGDLTARYGKPFGDGQEAQVFRDGDNWVVKASYLGMGSQEPLQKIERLMLSNEYFPESAYGVEGIGVDENDEMVFQLRQPLVRFNSDDQLSDEEIQEWLERKGWKLRDDFLRHYVSEGGDLACMDMHNENVVKDKTGNIVCLDPCVIPNVYSLEMKGFYDYDRPAIGEFDSGEYEEETNEDGEDDEYAQYADFEG